MADTACPESTERCLFVNFSQRKIKKKGGVFRQYLTVISFSDRQI